MKVAEAIAVLNDTSADLVAVREASDVFKKAGLKGLLSKAQARIAEVCGRKVRVTIETI